MKSLIVVASKVSNVNCHAREVTKIVEVLLGRGVAMTPVSVPPSIASCSMGSRSSSLISVGL